MIDVLNKYYPDYSIVFNDMMNYTNLNLMDNVFVTKWKFFKAYSKWLFDILLCVDEEMKKIDPGFNELKSIRNLLFRKGLILDDKKIKCYSWLAEHLFIVWILKNRMIRIEKWMGEFTFY